MTTHLKNPYSRIYNFAKLKESFGIESTLEGKWKEQENGVLVRQLISEELSDELDLTYIGLQFSENTDGHKYHTQTDTIHFITDGLVEFATNHSGMELFRKYFIKGAAIQIPPHVIRKICVPEGGLEIELIVQPQFNIEDEIHVYD